MKKNKLYVNKVNDSINNNQRICNVIDNVNVINNYKNIVEDKLEKIFNTNGYIFNVNVKIITNNKTYNTKIASRVGNSLITLDNDIIPINAISDIVF